MKVASEGRVRKVLTGSHSVAYGALLSRVQVISSYPITPQTAIVELLSEMVAEGNLKARYINVESEHSAMTACIGASVAGARAFTATSSQGLAYMHEMLHWASGARLPIVMVNVNRSLAVPLGIWTDQNDSLAQRDTGWIQLYTESNQEILDSIIQAFKIAERVSLPVMVNMDGFVHSHTMEPVELYTHEEVDRFLPPYKPAIQMNTKDPRAHGIPAMPDATFEFRYIVQEAHRKALNVIREVGAEFGERFGRSYDLMEEVWMDDADTVVVTSSTITTTARFAIKRFREETGEKVGLLKIRVFRPTPYEALREKLGSRAKVIVLDRNLTPGHGGIFAQEIRSALYNLPRRVPLYNYVLGLGGRDVRPEDIRGIIEDAMRREDSPDVLFWGVKL